MRRHLIPLLLLSVFALSGCGVTGNLKTPPPLFGDKTKTPPAEDQKAEDDNSEDEDLIDILDDLND